MSGTLLPEAALSGSDAPPPDVMQRSAPPDTSMAGALSNDYAIPGPPLAQKIATSANTAASQQSPQQAAKPGSWARTLLAGVQEALSGFVAGGGAGPQAAENQQRILARKDQQKQQAVENQQKQQQMTREEAIARATIAHENAATAHDQMLMASLQYDNRQKNVATGTASIQPYIKAGAPILEQGIDSDELQQMIQQKKLDPTTAHAFATGEKPVFDAEGKQRFDEAGNPLTRPTYSVVGEAPQVELDEATSALISQNTPYKLPPGSKMSGLVYGTLMQQATSAQTATMAIDEARNELKLKALDTDQKLAAAKMLPDWNTALAKTKNDPFGALRFMETDPQMRQKHPDAATQIQSLYGGPKEWEAMRHNRVEEAQKAAEAAQKKISDKNAAWGNPEATTAQDFRASLTSEQQAAVDLVGQGRAPINRPDYILARNPGFIAAMAKLYPQVDLSKISAYQEAYKKFTSGHEASAVNSGATALEHLNELRALNTAASMVPGTPAHTRYQNKVNTLTSELMNFYKVSSTEANEKDLKSGLNAMTTWNRNAAIETQAKSMGDKIDNYRDQWDAAAPSPQYEAQYPGISETLKARTARAQIDPGYAAQHPELTQGAGNAPAPTHRVLNKADGKYHFTDATGSKDLGVVP